MDNVLHQHNWKRAAALTALFAILLIVVAPLISVSLQKDPMSAMPGMHHDMSMMSMDEHHGDMPHSMPVDHADPIPARRRVGLLSPFKTKSLTFCLKKEKYDYLHSARGMGKPAASPPFLYWAVCRSVYLLRSADRNAVCRHAAA
ncbi:MAG: DUF2946 family protein [Enterobacter hormaechei]|nr:DUF2946 family protein [Enterobacter hormaechei]